MEKSEIVAYLKKAYNNGVITKKEYFNLGKKTVKELFFEIIKLTEELTENLENCYDREIPLTEKARKIINIFID